MNTLLFAIGIAVFMVTVYGAVMAGGNTLRRHRRQQFADDVEMIVNEDGFDVMTSSESDRTHHASDRSR